VTSSSAKKIVAWRECLFRHGLEGEDAHALPRQVKMRHIPTRPRDPGNVRPLAEEQDSQIRKAHFICHQPNKVHRVPCHGDPEGEQKYSSALSSTSALDRAASHPEGGLMSFNRTEPLSILWYLSLLQINRFSLSYSNLFLLTHCRCRRLLLHLITLKDTHTHTHTSGRTYAAD